MTARRNVTKDADIRLRVPSKIKDEFARVAARLQTTPSELMRRLMEAEIATYRSIPLRPTARRLRRLRRCLSCGAFVRSGYTCKLCRPPLGDRILFGGAELPVPSIQLNPLPLRPDVRDPSWAEAEAVVLDAYAPIVALVYECLSGNPSFEMTDLDDIADLLTMAASICD